MTYSQSMHSSVSLFLLCVTERWSRLQQRSPWDVGDARCSARSPHSRHANADPGSERRIGRVSSPPRSLYVSTHTRTHKQPLSLPFPTTASSLEVSASYTCWPRSWSLWRLCCCCVCYWSLSWLVPITRNCMLRVKATRKSWSWGWQRSCFLCWRYTLCIYSSKNYEDLRFLCLLSLWGWDVCWLFLVDNHCRWPIFWMFPWSLAVFWQELCCPHRVTWLQQRSWDV